jgi:hypothetical protein
MFVTVTMAMYQLLKYEKHKREAEDDLYYTYDTWRRSCSYFGCVVLLTPEESLCGNRCIHHQKQVKPINIVDKYFSK